MAILAATIWSDQLYWWLAFGATALFVLKMVFSFIGGAMDHGDFDVAGGAGDVDVHDGGMPADHGSFSVFTFFSLQSLLAFFMGMGWMGVVAGEQWGFDPTPTLLLSLAFGTFLLALNGVVMLFIRRLHSEAHYDLQTSKGRIGRVYMNIPAKGEGTGQVEVNVSGQRKIVRALSHGPAIASFTEVRILDIIDGQSVLVAAESEPKVSANVSPGHPST